MAEQKAEDIQHALNLMLNLGFERFHTARSIDGAVHEFELGTVRNLPAPDEIHREEAQKIIATMTEQVTSTSKETVRTCGVSVQDAETIRSAFVYPGFLREW